MGTKRTACIDVRQCRLNYFNAQLLLGTSHCLAQLHELFHCTKIRGRTLRSPQHNLIRDLDLRAQRVSRNSTADEAIQIVTWPSLYFCDAFINALAVSTVVKCLIGQNRFRHNENARHSLHRHAHHIPNVSSIVTAKKTGR